MAWRLHASCSASTMELFRAVLDGHLARHRPPRRAARGRHARAALALGIDPGLRPLDALRARKEKRAPLIAAANSYMGRIVVVVHDDIDPSNLADVMWAVTTRCEPCEQIDIVRNAWSSALDPRIPPTTRPGA